MIASKKSSSRSQPLTGSELLDCARNSFDRLKHLQNIKDPNRQGRIVSCLINTLKKTRATRTDLLRRTFFEKYQVNVGKDNSITFTIPENSSPAELLKEAQAISLVLRKVVAIYPPRLSAWMKDPSFTKNFTRAIKRRVIPIVLGSGFKSRPEQASFLSKNRLEMAEAWELACAHAVYSIFKNQRLADLFDGNIIRVKNTKLYYGNGGLSEMDENDYVNNCSYKNVKTAAAIKLPSSNK